MLSDKIPETIVTARIFQNGVEVEDITPYTFVFEPEGAYVFENGELVKNKRKYTIYDIYRSANVRCTVKCDPSLLM